MPDDSSDEAAFKPEFIVMNPVSLWIIGALRVTKLATPRLQTRSKKCLLL
jgi:hypothetical protein